jgi:hypothetical protein
MTTRPKCRPGARAAIGGILMTLALLAAAGPARGAQIVPSIGTSKAVNGNGDATTFGGVAFRAPLAPLLESEIGVAYRSESRFDDQLRVRTWPVTASLYLKPVPALYAGGGVGWYHTTLDYASGLPFADETTQNFGVHVGGGLQVPLGTNVAVDLNGRYVMMRDQESRLVPEKFNPDYWMTSMGLAIGF